MELSLNSVMKNDAKSIAETVEWDLTYSPLQISVKHYYHHHHHHHHVSYTTNVK
jgi:hypothetical protein